MQAAGPFPPQPFSPQLPRSPPRQRRVQPQPHVFPLLPSMVSADFCTAAVLISAGAVLGRVNPVQMLLLTLLGVTLFTLNEYILHSLMGVSHQSGWGATRKGVTIGLGSSCQDPPCL